MIVKLEHCGVGDGFIPIPKSVIDQMGWKAGDELVLDFPTIYTDQMIVYKKTTISRSDWHQDSFKVNNG